MPIHRALRTLALLTVIASATALAPAARAANATFISEATFIAAAGNTVVESFEALAARNRVLTPITTPLLTVTPGIAPLGVQTGRLTVFHPCSARARCSSSG